MNEKTLLLRQVNPSFIQEGKITSQVFRPTPKDEKKLSVYDNDKITPEEAFNHFCNQPNCHSCGVMAVSMEECKSQDLPIIEDAIPIPAHCSIDFEAFSENQICRKAKFLKRAAEDRGWLYQEISN